MSHSEKVPCSPKFTTTLPCPKEIDIGLLQDIVDVFKEIETNPVTVSHMLSGCSIPATEQSFPSELSHQLRLLFLCKLQRLYPYLILALPRALKQWQTTHSTAETSSAPLLKAIEDCEIFISGSWLLSSQMESVVGTVIDSSSIIMPGAVIEGNVKIAAGCVVHPWCKIRAITGPIIIQEGCCVEEFTEISNQLPSSPDNKPTTMTIGSHSVIRAHCRIQAKAIGEGCQIGNHVDLEKGSILGNYVHVNSFCKIATEERVSPYSIVSNIQGRIHTTVAEVSEKVLKGKEFNQQQVKVLLILLKQQAKGP